MQSTQLKLKTLLFASQFELIETFVVYLKKMFIQFIKIKFRVENFLREVENAF